MVAGSSAVLAELSTTILDELRDSDFWILPRAFLQSSRKAGTYRSEGCRILCSIKAVAHIDHPVFLYRDLIVKCSRTLFENNLQKASLLRDTFCRFCLLPLCIYPQVKNTARGKS